MRAHVISSGANAGRYEPCPRSGPCGRASTSRHARFWDARQMRCCNSLLKAAPGFAPNGMLPALFGGITPMMVMDPLISPWDDGCVGVYPPRGDGGEFCRIAESISGTILDYTDRVWVDVDIHERCLRQAEDAAFLLWGDNADEYGADTEARTGADGGMFTAQNGSTIMLGDGWEPRIIVKAVKNRGGAPVCGHDILSDGSMAVSLEHDPTHNPSASPAVIIARKHENTAVTILMKREPFSLTAETRRIGDAVAALGGAADSRYGADCSLNVNIGTGSATLLSKEGDEPQTRRLTIRELESELDGAAEAVATIRGMAGSASPPAAA